MSVRLTDPKLAGPCMFWYWNATPTHAQIAAQVAEIAAAGFEGLYVHPMPQSFRPAEFNGGMEVEYLSPEFFDLIAYTCESIKRHSLIMWLYDEGGWPSGRAGGEVVKENPAYRIWLLEQREGRAQPVQMTDGCTYPDLMNPAATDCFMRLTHERYKAAVGSEFGRTVRGIFTDEARLLGRVGTSQMPWTPDLPVAFEVDHGYPLEPVVAHLFQSAAADSVERKTQRDYLSTMGRLIARNYYQRINQWCEANGLLFEGHHSGEDEFARHGQYFGDYLQQARYYHIPGADTIWRQIHPGRRGGNFVQLASSAAWLRGSRIALSESFGVYGPGVTLEQMKWIASHQAVRGISKIGVMAYHLSTDGASWLGICSETSGRTPIWSHIDLWTAFMHNVAAFLCRGDPVLSVGVYYRTELTRPGEESAFTEDHERLCDRLGDQLLGWVFVGLNDLIDAKVDDGTLRTGAVSLKAVVVHIDGPMQPDEARIFDRLSRAGVRVIVIEAEHRAATSASIEVIDAIEQLDLSALRTVDLDRQIDGVRLLELSDGEWHGYLIFNQNAWPVEFKLRSRTFVSPLVSQELEAVSPRLVRYEHSSADGTIVHLGPGELRAYETSKEVHHAEPLGRELNSTAIEGSWRMQPIESFVINNGVIRPRVDAEQRSVSLGGLHETMPGFSGTVSYTTSIDIEPARAGETLSLDLGTVLYAADVFVNGRPAGRRAWSPYIFDITSHVTAGTNQLEVRVTSTLASTWLEAVAKMNPAWRSMYVEKVEPWTSETCGLGLVGPVVLNRYRR